MSIINKDLLNIKFFLPILSGYLLSMLCKMSKNDGKELPQRPPAYVFGIVWPILYLLLGYSWSKSGNQYLVNILHGICTLLLCMWIIVYSCMKKKKYGIYTIALTISVVIACMCLHRDKYSKIALIPLLAWLLIAFQLNWNIIN